jgi:hypothetical protein
MTKKMRKVKRKRVVSKKKKVVKKKSAKKKIISKKKKSAKKKVKKKKSTRKKYAKRKRKKATMEDLYKMLNKVQLKKKKVKFVVQTYDADVYENIIKDVGLDYNRENLKTQVNFILYPTDKQNDYEMLELEYMDDEIIEDGQIFP